MVRHLAQNPDHRYDGNNLSPSELSSNAIVNAFSDTSSDLG